MVLAPVAICTRMAFSNAARVRISEGRISFSTSSMIMIPVPSAMWIRCAYTAGIEAHPGSVSPSASAIDCTLLAVPITPQAPQVL